MQPFILKSHSLTASLSSTNNIGSLSSASSSPDRHHALPYCRPVGRILVQCLCFTLLLLAAIAAWYALLYWMITTPTAASSASHTARLAASRSRHPGTHAAVTLDVRDMPVVRIGADAESAGGRVANCSYWDCFDVYRCGRHGARADRMTIYVYPLAHYVDAVSGEPAAPLSRDFHRVLRAIRQSAYYTADPNEACVFVPSVDLLNANRFAAGPVERVLAGLDFWGNGENHLLFNMVSGRAPHFNTTPDIRTGRAMMASAGFDTWTYRHGFDLAIPFYMAGVSDAAVAAAVEPHQQRPYLLIAGQLNLFARHNRVLQELAYDHADSVLVLQECQSRRGQATDDAAGQTPRTGNSNNDQSQPHSATDSIDAQAAKQPDQQQQPQRAHDWRCAFPAQRQQRHDYPAVLRTGRFCLVARGMRLVPLNLLETMAAGCVPVFMADNLVLPFEEIIDWTLASVRIRETNLHALVARLQAISAERVAELRAQVLWLHARYFSSLERVVHTALDQLNDRIFPHLARDQRAWNQAAATATATGNAVPHVAQNPLFLSLTAGRAPGFTAVVLTYDRVESLFTLVEKLSVVPSLHKILVVWNNQKKAPPHLSQFPKIAKPLQVIRTSANKLSNRFYPYAEIETEAILTIDDDIVMLTADELDFGYEVWREFPDRIVGFPSRTHVWDNGTGRWRYESEWTNEISMVLTGAAFHHKYWSHMYTTAMPGDIKQWVDDHMNCEDIAMNFLVAHVTGQPPIKVAPRKKFKCPECTNIEMLSSDLNHMLERSACIDRFARIYGRMPLRTVEFRADPVLYKDNFPEKLKRFNDIGSL